MLDIKHLKLDRNGKRYLDDTSFQLARCGFVSITCDDAVAGEYLAYLLGGIVQVEEGCFLFEERDMAEERNRLYYRRECVSFLSGDFQLFPERSVEENILLHLSCEKKELDHVLRFWKLSDVRREALQDLPFEQQFYTALARCMLKKSRILVFYPAHSFLSEHEQRQIYPILRRLSSHMLIITVDAADTFPYHTRLIEIKEGYMESDSGQMELGYPDVPFYGRADVVEGDMLRLWKQCRRHYRWGYRGLRLFLIALLLMLYALYYCKKHGEDKEKIHAEVSVLHEKGFVKVFLDSFWALLTPVIILGCIYSGIASPTEAAVISVFYALIISMCIYRTLKFRDLKGVLVEAIRTFAPILFILSAAVAFSRIITLLQIPEMAGEFILSTFSGKVAVLLVINVLLLIVGMVMDTSPAILILTPILIPITNSLGIDPIQFGIIMVVNLAIGFVTPPIGINLFVASSLTDVPVMQIAKKAMPLIVFFLIALLAITFIPQISLLLVS